MKNIKVLEIRSEIGAGTRGASLGIDAVKVAALDYGSLLFKNLDIVRVKDENYLLYEPYGSPYAKRIRGMISMYERVMVEVSRTLKNRNFALVLSGDHATSGAIIGGIRSAYPKQSVGVIWVDAHADLHSPYTTPSGNLHGMPLAAALAEDNMDNRVNKVDKDTADDWNRLKNVGNICPKINYGDLVYVGLRDMEPQEEYLIRKHAVKNFTTEEVRHLGVEKIAREALQLLNNCAYIYVSFDVDCMDSSISRGTGTPAPNGITEKEAGNLLARLVQSEKVCCLEISEVNPTFDRENLMAENVFEIIQKVVGQLTN